MNSRIRGQSGTKRSHRCKCKYKMRGFYSKGAFLVLFWVFFSIITISMTFKTSTMLKVNNYYPEWMHAVPLVVGVLVALPLGWLANTRIGIYNATKCGILLLFLTTLTISFCTLIIEYDFMKSHQYISSTLFCLIGPLNIIGLACFVVSILQLGLDQMPDASSSNITSFITWLLVSIILAGWTSNSLYEGYWICLRNDAGMFPISSIQLCSLIPVLCMSVVVVTDFLFAKKWLIIEPKTSQTIKIAYQVLKFAAKHKAPLNRSALTYWEEDIPSRMDLGKLRYGGPFTTEQVEDVKIVLRLLVLSLPLWVLTFSVNYGPMSYSREVTKIVLPNWTDCNIYILFSITYKSEWWVLITTVLFEFIIYPLVRERLPSILKRIGIVAFVNFVLSVLFLTLSLVHHFTKEKHIVLLWVLTLLFHTSRGIQLSFLFCSILELVYAQAPYNTRGLFTGYFTACILFSGYVGTMLTNSPPKLCTNCNIQLILFGVKCLVSLFGLVLYCLLARWYKRRVRDEEYNVHRVVEEVYDRYLSARVGQK